jgi:hypothetical protein
MSSYTQAEGSTMIAASSRIHSEPTTTNASHPTVKFETKRPRKTKYYDIVRPKVKTPLYQHVGILRYRTEGPNGGNGIVIPQHIGLHVIDKDYQAPRTPPPFKRVRPQDLFFPLTPLEEWEKLDENGIEATDALVTMGEIILVEDKKSRKWMCTPSPLRGSWTYT